MAKVYALEQRDEWIREFLTSNFPAKTEWPDDDDQR